MDKREKIVFTAKKMFATNGFYSTATARIAKEAGVSNGLLFHYFPTKDELIRSLYFEIKDKIFRYSQEQVYKNATLKESIYTLWLAAIEWYLENPEDFDFMLQFENSPFYSIDIEKSHRYVQMSMDLFKQGVEQRIFKQVSPLLLFQLLSGLVDTTVKFLRYNPEFQKDIEYKNRLFEIAWDAIRK